MKEWCVFFETCIRNCHKCAGHKHMNRKEWYDSEISTIRRLWTTEEAAKKIDTMKLSWKHNEYLSPIEKRNLSGGTK